ncbi:uncharacterized protein G2W53_006704 [Senna tora]|uniref:Uncharacterized protein n=1 Tax=Senna tora TaxID=362788 RepID=A0A834X4H6_9FABA|nr:uncharacterized protein G2W53_006704 [Senna tora]
MPRNPRLERERALVVEPEA